MVAGNIILLCQRCEDKGTEFNVSKIAPTGQNGTGDGPLSRNEIGTRNAHAAKPRTKCMKNGTLKTRRKAEGRFATMSAPLRTWPGYL